MIIGVPKEIKTAENRIALVPAGAETLGAAGHTVLVEQGAGEGSGFADDLYETVGATIVPDVNDVWAQADMIIKVKEPIEPEWPRMRQGQVVFITGASGGIGRGLTAAFISLLATTTR